jgi:hypothetical protein
VSYSNGSSFAGSDANPQQPAVLLSNNLRSTSEEMPKKKKKKKSHKSEKKERGGSRERMDEKKKKKKKSSKRKSSNRTPPSSSSLIMMEDASNKTSLMEKGETSDILTTDDFRDKSPDSDSVWGDENQWNDDVDWNEPKISMAVAASIAQQQRVRATPTRGGGAAQQQQQARRDQRSGTSGGFDLSNMPDAIDRNCDEEGFGIMGDLQSFAEENRSVLAGDDRMSSRHSQNSSNQSGDFPARGRRDSVTSGAGSDEVPHELLVNYMLAMGANRDMAEQLAASFASEQEASASSSSLPQPASAGRQVRPAAVTLSSKLRYAEQGHNPRPPMTRDQRSATSFPITGQQSISGYSSYPNVAAVSGAATSRRGEKIVEATPVMDIESDVPIVYAESAPLALKHLVNERPVRRLFCLGVLVVIGAVIGIVVYFTVLKENPKPKQFETSFLTMSPSLAPTFISDDVLAAAEQLSGYDILANTSSPQFKAVGWMSSVDPLYTGALGGNGFAQRYALVVMYYSFQGEDWINQEQWLSPDLHECEWSSGIFCRFDGTQSREVTRFDATRNNLHGTIPEEIGLLSNSENFRLPKNSVGGTIPDSVGQMTSMTVMDMHDNLLSGSLPVTIGGARDLIILDLSENQLNSSIPVALYTLKHLRTLTLTSNQLTGKLDPSINNLTSLVTLDLRHNLISGELPVTLDDLEALDIVLLDHNLLSGSLPVISSSLIFTQTLSLSNNLFSGNIGVSPDYELTFNDDTDYRLMHVDISYNLLSGPISPVFGFLPTFRYLDLSGNSFVGGFRSDIGWSAIEFLAASNNFLTGTVPTGWATLSKLLLRETKCCLLISLAFVMRCLYS